MKKRVFSLFVFIVMLIAAVLSMASCGNREIVGVSLSTVDQTNSYDKTSDTTACSVSIRATNSNVNRAVSGFSYNVFFYDANGNLLYKSEEKYSSYISGNETETINKEFDVQGKVASVSVEPISMELNKPAGKSIFTDLSTWDASAWFGMIIVVALTVTAVVLFVKSAVAFFKLLKHDDIDIGNVSAMFIIAFTSVFGATMIFNLIFL